MPSREESTPGKRMKLRSFALSGPWNRNAIFENAVCHALSLFVLFRGVLLMVGFNRLRHLQPRVRYETFSLPD